MATNYAPAARRPLRPIAPELRSALARAREYAEPRRRRALALILALAALCNFYELQRNGFANLYYAAAIRSMLESWHNFFFVAFDPGGFVTVDKPPLGFWIQAASAKLLGYSGFSILLPEALAGVASVGVLYVLVRRLFGSAAGLLAALFLAITPISVVTSRNNTIDSLLVLTVLLGAYAVSRAAEQGSLRWLLLAAVLVGLGFNIKMLEAYLVVPAFAAVYLLGVPLGWWKRLRHLAVAGGALLAVSLAWVLTVDLTPVSARPYVGSSGTNSELTLALGYNGLQRLLGSFFTFARASTNDAATSTAPGGPGSVSENGAQGLFRLLNAQLGGQASWLLALGLIGALAAGWGFRPRGFLRTLPERLRLWRRSAEARAAAHLTPQQSALVLWGFWTLTMAIFFSVASFFHRYYLSMLAPGIAALAGVGVVLLWRDYKATGWRGWLLPAALVATAVTQAVILADYTGWNAWMTPLVIVGSLIVAGVLVWYRVRGNAEAEESSFQGSAQLRDTPSPSIFGRLSRVAYMPLLAAVLGVGLLLVGPAMWTGVSLAQGAGGTLPSAGPSTTLAASGGPITGGFPGGSGRFPEGFRPGGGSTFSPPVRGFGGRDGGAFTPPAGVSGGRGAVTGMGGQRLNVDSTLLKYLEVHQGSATYLFGTLSSQTAAPYIIETGKAVMALGGFSGSDKILTLSQLKALIREGQIKYFLLSGGGFRRLGGGSGNSPLVSWIEAHTTQVPASTYGGSTSGGTLYAVTSATVSAAQP